MVLIPSMSASIVPSMSASTAILSVELIQRMAGSRRHSRGKTALAIRELGLLVSHNLGRVSVELLLRNHGRAYTGDPIQINKTHQAAKPISGAA